MAGFSVEGGIGISSMEESERGLREPIKAISRARSASPTPGRSRHSGFVADYGTDVKVFGGVPMNDHAVQQGIKHAIQHAQHHEEHVQQMTANRSKGIYTVAPKRSASANARKHSTPHHHAFGATPVTVHSHSQKGYSAPKKASGRRAAEYDRPWLQKTVKVAEKGDPALAEAVKQAKLTQKKLEKEKKEWWQQEAEKMTDVISKLTATTEQLTNDLAEAKQNVRHSQYELGLTQATYERQSEQAQEQMQRRMELEEEVIRLQREKEDSSHDSVEKNGERQSLSLEVQDLEQKLSDARDSKVRCAEREAREKDKEKARRDAAHAEKDKREGRATAARGTVHNMKRAGTTPLSTQLGGW